MNDVGARYTIAGGIRHSPLIDDQKSSNRTHVIADAAGSSGMLDCTLMPGAEVADGKLRKLVSTHPLISVVVGAVLGAALNPLGTRIYKSFDVARQEDAAFQQSVRDMEVDLRNNDRAAFIEKAKEFRRSMEADRVPKKYGLSAEMTGTDGDIAALAKEASDAIDLYLRRCDAQKAIYNEQQLDYDCEQELESNVTDSLLELDHRIDIDRISGK